MLDKWVLASFGMQTIHEELDLPDEIPKNTDSLRVEAYIHSTQQDAYTYKARSSEVLLSAACPRSGINQMWILKNSKELLEHLKSTNFINKC